MSLSRTAVRLLDRPGMRPLLARIAKLRTGVRVDYDGRWMRILPDGLVLVDLPRFPYFLDTLGNTAREVELTEASARDNWFFDYTPSSTDIVVDVGAGTGIETRVFAEGVGHVYAIEAQPETFARLEAAVKRNGWTNVTPIFAAVTDRPGTVYIEDDSKDLRNALADTGLPVPGRTFDDICDEHGITHIDFLKMNIEGSEQLAIRGMTATIERTQRLCIACHDFRVAKTGNEFFRTKAIITEFLRNHGFQTTTRDDHPKVFARDHVYARR